ncbi:hypothetical protein TKK_0018584 [Trichogramma kaykai]
MDALQILCQTLRQAVMQVLLYLEVDPDLEWADYELAGLMCIHLPDATFAGPVCHAEAQDLPAGGICL